MDDQDLNALLDGDTAETAAESSAESADPAADVSEETAAIDAGETPVEEPASEGTAEMSAGSAADLAADMMGDAAPTEAAMEASAETGTNEPPTSEASGKDSAKVGDAKNGSNAKADKKAPTNLDERLKQELGFANLYLRDCESLILFRVFNKVHIAYYEAWVRDARGAMALISSLRRRRQRHLNALAKATKKDTESAA